MTSCDSLLYPRSTPCPSVKHGDEWGEPSRCDSGDSCQYCHSRTEQQFHPEVQARRGGFSQMVSVTAWERTGLGDSPFCYV